ncbi:helix-turn-helix domain-containing protein [Rhodobacter xanthinilyticus]|uniref:helix-turn-helix domain-containing protein n=1 Tax=Rhodobacter xanthinilyticus TaxID=1850250 RepID=UPI0009F4AE8F
MRPKARSRRDVLFLQNVGRHLRTIRRGRGLTQAEFAELLDLSREGYANYELGKREMGITVARDVRHKMQVDLLAPDTEADHSRSAPLPHEAEVERSPKWLTALMDLRVRLIAAREAFDREQFTALRRRLHSIRDVAFVSSTITVWLRLVAPEFGWHRVDAVAQIDWALLLGFAMAALLLPFQGWYIGRFFYWMHATPRCQRRSKIGPRGGAKLGHFGFARDAADGRRPVSRALHIACG